jgi:RimJ/RimL family protein N-acetyltransferase
VTERIHLQGRRVVLRPFRRAEERTLWAANQHLDQRVMPRRPPSHEWIRKVVDRSGRLYRGRLDLAIEARGRLIGEIQARTSPAQSLPPGVFELGIVIWQPRHRLHGYGAEAVELLARWLLEEKRAGRVQLSTAAANRGMRRAAERVGFRMEGELRRWHPSPDGDRDDWTLYAVTSSDELIPG